MLLAGRPIHVPAQNLVLHEQHPAINLDPAIRNRLMDIYVDSAKGERRITKRALLLMAQLNPINVTGTLGKPHAISGWSLVHALKSYNVEDSIPCIIRPKLSGSAIHEVVLTDFFLAPSSIERQDEIAKRIKAICMHAMNNDADLKEIIAPGASNPKLFFSLPERRRGTLAKEIREESAAVRVFIETADKPLGAGITNEPTPKKIEVLSETVEETSVLRVANDPTQEENDSQPYQSSLFQDQDR